MLMHTIKKSASISEKMLVPTRTREIPFQIVDK